MAIVNPPFPTYPVRDPTLTRAAYQGGPAELLNYASSSELCSIASRTLATDIRLRPIWFKSWSAFPSSASDFERVQRWRCGAIAGRGFCGRVAGNLIVHDTLRRADQCKVREGVFPHLPPLLPGLPQQDSTPIKLPCFQPSTQKPTQTFDCCLLTPRRRATAKRPRPRSPIIPEAHWTSPSTLRPQAGDLTSDHHTIS
jgi:hypothetical protein